MARRRTRPRAIVTPLVVALLASTGVAACSDDEGAAPPANEARATEDTEYRGGPEPDPDDVDDPRAFAFGQVLEIDDRGLKPALLAADVNDVVTVKNTTEGEQRLLFTAAIDEAGTIELVVPAGGEVSFDPVCTCSFAYDVATLPGTSGVIQVEDQVDAL